MKAPTHSDPSQRKNLSSVLTLTAVAVLVVGFFAYHNLGSNTDEVTPEPLFPISSQDPIDVEQKSSDTAAIVSTQAEQPTTAPSQSVATETALVQPEEVMDDDAPTAINMARENQAMQTQYLREALPGNEMIPYERTPDEAEAMMAEFKEHNELRQKIESGEATAEDQLRFYELRASKLEDEIELIKLCQDVQANALDAGEESAATLCKNATANGEQRLQKLQEMLAELEKKYL